MGFFYQPGCFQGLHVAENILVMPSQMFCRSADTDAADLVHLLQQLEPFRRTVPESGVTTLYQGFEAIL